MKEQRRNYVISYLRCKCCGSIMPIPRRKAESREKDHIKTMYCFRCCEIRDFLENHDSNDFEVEEKLVDEV